MAKLIKKADIELIKDRAKIDEIVAQHVLLRPAGLGSLKGLCPFHDEKTPSFHVNTAKGFYHCFGCGQGGDVFEFVQQIMQLSFSEAVEYLAEKTGVQLHYEQDKVAKSGEVQVTRTRLIALNQLAETFFKEQLGSQGAKTGQQFLLSRGFGPKVAAQFGVGYAPDGWSSLLDLARKRGFIEAELEASGLFSRGQRGLYDRFRDRLIWPIRDLTGATVGFGARRLDDNQESPKYLNTPETRLYKKSQVLYGIDLARKQIGADRQAVVVEGYTDVMAAHLSGIKTAVATCGTAFGSGHVRILRRLLGDSADRAAGVILHDGSSRGAEVIFTFDGDEAGQKAALRAFGEDQSFAAQTFVAVDPSGKDPCDLYQSTGPAAVRELLASRQPLFVFVLKSILNGFDLRRSEGRVAALHGCAPVVVQIRDHALRSEYTRQLSGWLGLPLEEVAAACRQAYRQGKQNSPSARQSGFRGRLEAKGTGVASGQATNHGDFDQGAPRSGNSEFNRGGANSSEGPGGGFRSLSAEDAFSGEHLQLLNSKDPLIRLEKNALVTLLQTPYYLVSMQLDQLKTSSFSQPAYGSIFASVLAIGGIEHYIRLWQEAERQVGEGTAALSRSSQQWIAQIKAELPIQLQQLFMALVVSPIPQDNPDKMAEYVQGIWRSVLKNDLNQQIVDLRSEMSRSSDSAQAEEIFKQILLLDQRKRQL